MEKALAKKSDFIKLKYKFFIIRVVIYFSFLFIPVWIQEIKAFSLVFQSIVLLAYMMFMGGQWYLMGKEIDHRLRIYYRANSSMERIVYRLVLGCIAMMLLFNVFSLFPTYLVKYLFWGFFVLLGIFYSWPTRGKIIEETMFSQFGEVKYLDSFEKTIVALTSFTFIISLPELQLFQNIEALKLYFDPHEQVSGLLWNFLAFLYFPFSNIPKFYNLVWSLHFYFIGLGLYILSFYCFLRYLFSRRLSLLGIYAVVSTWSFSKILGHEYFAAITTSLSVIWIWSLVWSSRSGTYRSGLFTGLVCCYLTMINQNNFLLFPLGLAFTYFFFLNNQTKWFKRQWLKYNVLGGTITLGLVLLNVEKLFLSVGNWYIFFGSLGEIIYRKAFFIISPVGVLLALIYFTGKSRIFLTNVSFDVEYFREILTGVVGIVLVGLLIQPDLVRGFSIIWIFALFALVPIEWIFQSMSRLRSKRNIIYVIYILVCLLDSHLENRLRIIGKLFLDIESLKYIIQL